MTALKERLRRAIGFNPVAWIGYARLMRRRFAEFAKHIPEAPQGAHCLVVVTPWEGTSIPWLSLSVGFMLAARGARLTFVIDDLPFGSNAVRYSFILAAIRHAMRAVPSQCRVISLSSVEVAPTAPTGRATELAVLNAVWQLRGEMIEEGRAQAEARNLASIAKAEAPIGRVFAVEKYDMMFAPGGVYGNSGLWVALAREAGVRVASYDNGGFGTWMTAADGLACHLGDIPRATEMIKQRIADRPEERARILAAAEEQIAKRRAGTDIFDYQVRGGHQGATGIDGAIMLALNSSWDSAALGVHDVFKTNKDWIVETVRFLLDTTDAPVIVRQHPAERLDFARTTDDYGALLNHHFGDQARLHFIAAADPVNSYALLPRVAAVVVHSSTIGTEAAAFGRVVITPSHAYYADLGFVWHARSLADYQALLSAAARGELQVAEAMRDDAKICYYVTQVRNWIHSSFNPETFHLWKQQPLEHWYLEPTTARMLDSLLDDVPVAVLNHLVSDVAGAGS